VATTRDEVRVRRAPKYPVFIVGGVIVGVVVTFIAVLVAPGRDATPFAQAFGYFVLYGIAIGAAVGSVVAVVLDAVSSRRARSVETEKTTVETPEADDVLDGEVE
jgi:gas vesicle protein